MKLTPFLILVSFLLTCKTRDVEAQDSAIKIGEQVPDFSFTDAWNYQQGKAQPFKLSDNKGKLVILDFWGTFCEPCLEGFSKLDSMQKKFGDKIQIITVTPQKKKDIDKFFSTHRAVFKPSLPFITGAKSLDGMFPHTGVPFQVWISPTSRLLYLADSYNLTDKNIQAVIGGANLKLRKAPVNVYPETLFDKKWVNDISYASYLVNFKYDDGLHLDGPSIGKGITDRGTIVDLYQCAFEGLTDHRYQFYRAGRTVVEAKDSSLWVNKYKGEALINWMEKHYFEYQLSVPESDTSNVYKLMLEDLNRYFNWNARITSRKVNCLALVRLDNVDRLKTMGGNPFNNCYPTEKRSESTGPVRYIVNEPFNTLSDLVRAVLENKFQTPYVDFAAYHGYIDFQLKADDLDYLDLNKLKKALNEYGLDLVHKEISMDVLVLKD